MRYTKIHVLNKYVFVNQTEKILKHFLSGGQYNNCHPPGIDAHGLLLGLLHGGGTIAVSVTIVKCEMHTSAKNI